MSEEIKKKNNKHYRIIIILLCLCIIGFFCVPLIFELNTTKTSKEANGEQKQVEEHIGYFDEDIPGDKTVNDKNDVQQSTTYPLEDNKNVQRTSPDKSLEEKTLALDKELALQTSKKAAKLTEKDLYQMMSQDQKDIYDNPYYEKGEWLPPYID